MLPEISLIEIETLKKISILFELQNKLRNGVIDISKNVEPFNTNKLCYDSTVVNILGKNLTAYRLVENVSDSPSYLMNSSYYSIGYVCDPDDSGYILIMFLGAQKFKLTANSFTEYKEI